MESGSSSKEDLDVPERRWNQAMRYDRGIRFSRLYFMHPLGLQSFILYNI